MFKFRIVLNRESQFKTPVTPEQRSHGDPMASKINADRQNARSIYTIASISAATHWHRQWTLWDRIERAHFEHAQNTRRGSATHAQNKRRGSALQLRSKRAQWWP